MMRLSITFSIIVLLIIAGCSGGSVPVSPGAGIGQSISEIQLTDRTPVGVTDWLPDGHPIAGMGIMGLFQLGIDPSDSSATLTSLRTMSSEDVLEVVDITNFMRMFPCTDCVKIKSVSLDTDGNVVVRIGIKHPFPVGDPMKPITGRNRADLHVFNVEGIIISDMTAKDFTGTGEKIAGFRLVNSDGYTGYLDGSIDDIFQTDATIHPYVLHFDDYSAGNFAPTNPMGFLSVTDPPPTGNLVMAMGCDYDFRDYVFALPSEPVSFIYAVGCTYAVSSDNKSQRFTPVYRIPQHSKKAASEVHVEMVTNNLKGGVTSSTAELSIKVLDMNHGIPVGTDLDQMRADSSVGSISVEIPSVTLTPVTVSSPTPVSGSGRDPVDPLDYRITVGNTASGAEGTYIGLVKVTDTYQTGLNGSPLLNGKDGIKRVDPGINPLTGVFDITEFATYAAFPIVVAPGTMPPTACFVTNPVGDPNLAISICTSVQFDASCSTDDGSITLYEWDFDWDGIPANFNDDTFGANRVVVSKFFGLPGNLTVALRVTDDEVPGLTDIVSIEVQVNGSSNADITGTSTTAVNLDRRYYVDMIESHGNWTYVLNKGTYMGNQGLWVYASCALGEGWNEPFQVSNNTLDNVPIACALDVTVNGRPVVAWIDSSNHACVSIATDETAQTWSARQDVYSTAAPYLRNVDIACHPTNQEIATLAIIDYDRPSSFPHKIVSRKTGNFLSGSPPSWNEVGNDTYLGYWTIWDVQDVNIEMTTDGEMDQVVWRYWPSSTIGNVVYHRRWTPGGQYGTWSACCGYVSGSTGDNLIKSSPDLIIDSQNRPVVVYAQADGNTGTPTYQPLPPWRLFINRGTDASNPSWGTPVEITNYATGNVDKPSLAQEPVSGDYWVVYEKYDTSPLEAGQILRARVSDALSVIDFDILWNDDDASNTHEDLYPHIVYASDSGVERMITIWYDSAPYLRINHKINDL